MGGNGVKKVKDHWSIKLMLNMIFPHIYIPGYISRKVAADTCKA